MTDLATLLNNTAGAYFIGCIINSICTSGLRLRPRSRFSEDVAHHEDLLRNEAITPKSWKRITLEKLVWALGGFIVTVVQQATNNNIIDLDNENEWPARTAVLAAAIADVYITLTMCRVLYRKKSVIRGTRELIMELIFYITSRGILTTLNMRNRFRERHYHDGNILISINLECQEMPPDPHAEREIELENISYPR
ncbi:predicted protein [Postia placenta Mad-698-R]|nr:predicted protein [Postia placenta Mad-698-R]